MAAMTNRRVERARGEIPGAGREDGDAYRSSVDLGPASTYEALTRQMVERMADDLDEIKGRLNGLLFLVAGAVILDTLARLVT